MILKKALPLACLILSFLLHGCSDSKPKWVSVSQKEAQDFAGVLLKRFEKGESAGVDALWDVDYFVDEQMNLTDSPEDMGISAGIKSSFRSKNNWAQFMVGELAAGGQLKFVSDHEGEGAKQLISFRLLSTKTGGTLYFDILVVRREAKDLGIGDVFFYKEGEYFSQQVERWQRDNLLEDLRTVKEALAKMMVEGKFSEFLTEYEKLSATHQTNSEILKWAFEASALINSPQVAKFFERYSKSIGDRAKISLFLLEGYRQFEQFDKAVELLAAINKRIGDDAYIHGMTGAFYFLAKNEKMAREHYAKALQLEENLPEICLMSLSFELQVENYGGALRMIMHLKDKCGVENMNFASYPNYEGLSKYPAFIEWKAKQDSAESK